VVQKIVRIPHPFVALNANSCNFSVFVASNNLTLGYYRIMKTLTSAASLMGRRSAEARRKKWGAAEFKRRMREWGKLGGRPKGKTGKEQT